NSGWLAVMHKDGTLRSHNLLEGKARILCRDHWCTCLAFRPDGKQFACSEGKNPEVQVRDAVTGEFLWSLPEPVFTTSLAWSPEGRLRAVAAANTRIYVGDARERRQQAVLDGHRSRVTDLCFGPSGVLASSSDDGTFRLWDAWGGKPLVSGQGRAVGFSPDGQRLACQNGARMGICEVADGRECRLLQPPRSPAWPPYAANECVSYDAAGRLLAQADAEGVRIWDTKTAQQVAHVGTGYHEAIFFHPGGRLITYGRAGLN